MSDSPKELKFVYTRASDYRVVASNGVQGGVTGRGDFRFDLFLESAETPNSVTHSITPDGLGPEIDRDPGRPDIIRELQMGVVMQVDQAKSFAHWILERVRLAESQKSG
jgi:hypothetical protein